MNSFGCMTSIIAVNLESRHLYIAILVSSLQWVYLEA